MATELAAERAGESSPPERTACARSCRTSRISAVRSVLTSAFPAVPPKLPQSNMTIAQICVDGFCYAVVAYHLQDGFDQWVCKRVNG